MSISPGEAPVNSAASATVTLLETIGKSFGISNLDRVSVSARHAQCSEHEDVPTSSNANREQGKQAEAKQRRSFEDRAPRRLTSLLPPENFGAVIPGSIYRSSFPKEENFGFLESLKLKTILTLVPEVYPEPNVRFMEQHGIRHFQVHIPANKDEVKIQPAQMIEALGVVLDKSNHPLLIHCNKGKHRTGCVVGCFRKCQGDNLETIFHEYHTYAGKKARFLDEAFMELFDERTVLWLARLNGFTPQNYIGRAPALLPSLPQPRAMV